MKISVVIPVYNEEKYLADCLQSIIDQVVTVDEIIVINNNSTDKSVEIAQRFPVRIINERKQGMIPARNRGFNEAKYDIIARTDVDTRVPADWIKRIKKDLSPAEIVGVSGRAYFYNLPGFIKNPYWPTSAFKRILRHDWMFGPNMALKKEAWNKIKNTVCLEDNEVHEDVDLALHLGKVGKIRYDPRLVVASSPRRLKKIKTYYEYPSRYLKTIQKHRDAIHLIPTDKISRSLSPKKLLKKSIQKFADF